MSAVTEVEHRTVAAGELRVHIAEAGSGPPLVLLHTSFQHWRAWRHLIPGLAEEHRVICPDMRGCGKTEAPARGYEKKRLAEDVLNLLDALELDRVGLAGHGLGGLVGFLAALEAPHRISRYLAIGVIHPWPRVDARFLASMWRSWYQPIVAAPGLGSRVAASRRFLTWLLRGTSPHPECWPEEEIAAYAGALSNADRARAASLMYRTFLTRELVPLLRGGYRAQRLTVPTRMIFGTRDRFLSTRTLRGHEGYADDLEIELLEGEGHFVHEERPDLIAARAKQFFAA